ncbi:MAG: PQQ-dependent sugar dehydrogenase [Pseudomonadota bacterium]
MCSLAALAGCGAESPPANAAEGDLIAADGFEVHVFHPGVGKARHLTVRDNGDVLVALRNGEVVALRDEDGDGASDQEERRELPIHTAIEVRGDHLYFADTVSVSRVALDEGLAPTGEVETVVSDFPDQNQHAAKTIAFDADGGLYVNSGAPSNACQKAMRSPGSPGLDPCPQLERQGGVWRFDAETLGQTQTQDGALYVTGVRHGLALEWNEDTNALYVTPHGRDQLDTLWPDDFTAEDNAEGPAEEFHKAAEGDHLGWPFTYYDPRRSERMLAPEYGGDGETPAEDGLYNDPLYAFPGHWAPNDMIFFEGEGAPEAYRGGALIAFHGSWNRAPLPQDGFRVSFLPLEDGVPSGPSKDFLNGFAGVDPISGPGQARYRPTGLAQGPDGAVYVADSVEGRIWKVTYAGE